MWIPVKDRKMCGRGVNDLKNNEETTTLVKII